MFLKLPRFLVATLTATLALSVESSAQIRIATDWQDGWPAGRVSATHHATNTVNGCSEEVTTVANA